MSGGAAPFFSVVVPTYRRPRQLGGCLAALARQTYPADRYEVIVVDDGSGAPPRAAVSAMPASPRVTLLTPAHGGPASARNHGTAHARGEFLAFTDDDCRPTPTWLTALAARLTAAPDALVGGCTRNLLTANPYSTTTQLLIDFLYAYTARHPVQPRFFASNNLAVAAEPFRAAGGFDADWPLAAAEDREFSDRWQHLGGRLIYAREAVVDHAHPLTARGFWQQHFAYGRGAWYFHRARAHRQAAPLQIAPPCFYLALLRYPFDRAYGRRAGRLALLLALSQFANASGFLWESRRPCRAARARLPVPRASEPTGPPIALP